MIVIELSPKNLLKSARNLAPPGTRRKQGISMNTSNIEIRPAIVSDARRLNDYVRTIFATSQHLITLPEEYRTGPFRQRFWIAGKATNPYEICLLAVSGKEIVGMIDSWTDRRARVKHVTTFAMSVHPDWRKQGIGEHLLGSFLGWVRENKRLEKVELHVHADNKAALSLYERLGFKTEGRREQAIRYGKNHFVDDILMAYWPNSSNVENSKI